MNDLKERLDELYKKAGSLAGAINVISVFVFPGIALFIWKLTQMSDWTRAFLNVPHQEMGQWFLGLLFLGFVYGMMAIIYSKLKEDFSKTRNQYTAKLRDAIVTAREDADTSKLVHVEAELREIEGYKLPAPWF